MTTDPHVQPKQVQIKDFYSNLLKTADVSASQSTILEIRGLKGISQPVGEADQLHFNPDEQDEENYQFQHKNEMYFNEVDSIDHVLVDDLAQENFEGISDASFMPRSP